jgi:hypothetical protein
MRINYETPHCVTSSIFPVTSSLLATNIFLGAHILLTLKPYRRNMFSRKRLCQIQGIAG